MSPYYVTDIKELVRDGTLPGGGVVDMGRKHFGVYIV